MFHLGLLSSLSVRPAAPGKYTHLLGPTSLLEKEISSSAVEKSSGIALVFLWFWRSDEVKENRDQ
jgi:hypothetical protein